MTEESRRIQWYIRAREHTYGTGILCATALTVLIFDELNPTMLCLCIAVTNAFAAMHCYSKA